MRVTASTLVASLLVVGQAAHALNIAGLLSTLTASFAAPLQQHAAPSSATLQTPYEAFVKHFSSPRPDTSIHLQTTLPTLYPNHTLTLTQDPHFALAAYPHALLKPLDDFPNLTKEAYVPALRRRDGDGSVREAMTWGGWTVAFGDDSELIAIVAQWTEGYQTFTQWHLLTPKPAPDEAAKKLIHDVCAWSSAIREAILVFDQSQWRPDHALWQAVQKASWEDVILDEPLKKAVQHDYRSFFTSEAVYKDLGVPWKRGLIFLGPPGNGKTISLKAIMKEMKIPILYVKSFHTYGGDELGIRMIFSRARAEAPCMLVLEDLDSLITDMNRSFFLNEVDGLEDNDGLLLIGTTNHFDKLDPALSNRPSRFDRKYNFPDPVTAERKQYAIYWQHKLRSNKDVDFPDSLVEEIAQKTKGFSFAYLKEAFVSTLLTLAARDDQHDGQTFGGVIVQQIKFLRDELDSGRQLGKDPFQRSGFDGGPSASRAIHFGGEAGVRMAQSSPMPRPAGRSGGSEMCFAAPVPAALHGQGVRARP